MLTSVPAKSSLWASLRNLSPRLALSRSASPRAPKRIDDCKTIDALPVDIMIHIFSMLPLDSLFRALQVSRRWQQIGHEEGLWERLVRRRSAEVAGLAQLTEGTGPRSWRRLHRQVFGTFTATALDVDMAHVAPPARKLSFELVLVGGPRSGKRTFKAQLMAHKHALPARSSLLVDDHALYIRSVRFRPITVQPLLDLSFTDDAPPVEVRPAQALGEVPAGGETGAGTGPATEDPLQQTIPDGDLYVVLFDLLNPESLETAKDVLVALNLWRPHNYPHMFLVGTGADRKAQHRALALAQQRTALAYAARFNVSRYCELDATRADHVEAVCWEAAQLLAGTWAPQATPHDACAPPPNYVYCSLQ